MNENWFDFHSVNIKILDRDHQQMAGLLSRLAADPSTKSADRILTELAAYAERHFRTEEQYLSEYNYPLKDSHAAQHRNFMDRLQEHRKQYESGRLEVRKLVEFLSSWWINHVNNSDQQYSDFLNQRGVY